MDNLQSSFTLSIAKTKDGDILKLLTIYLLREEFFDNLKSELRNNPHFAWLHENVLPKQNKPK